MNIAIKPSDLYYRYHRVKENRDVPKFAGKPDPAPFDRDDLFEVIPMFEAVMAELRTNDGDVLNMLEEILGEMPSFIRSREQVFDCLVDASRHRLGITFEEAGR